MQKRQTFQVDEAEISPAAQTDLEKAVENEKLTALPESFQDRSDNAFWEEEITGVDLDNAIDARAEIQPIEDSSLEEINQSVNLTEIDENTSEPPVVIKQDEKVILDADAGPLTTRGRSGERLKPELKTEVSGKEVIEDEPDKASSSATVGCAIGVFAAPPVSLLCRLFWWITAIQCQNWKF